MIAARHADPEQRRAELAAAAMAVFQRQGVSNTSVSDIVGEAGVAQGTFYLYFDTKDDIITAVVEALIEGAVRAIEAAAELPGAPAVLKLCAMRDAVYAMADEPHEIELMEFLHRPENLPLHERMTRGVGPRLLPVMVGIIEQGVSEGAFVSADPALDAAFVLGCFEGLEMATGDIEDASVSDLPRLLDAMTGFALRGLGYAGEIPRGCGGTSAGPSA